LGEDGLFKVIVGESGVKWFNSMFSFRGTFIHTLQPKNRVNIPAKYWPRGKKRTDEPIVVVLSRGLDGCIWLNPKERWDRIEKGLDSRSDLTFGKFRKFKRNLLLNVSDIEVDKQGRIIISRELLDYAGIEKEVLFHGLISYAELWSPEKFKAVIEETQEEFIKLAEELNLEV